MSGWEIFGTILGLIIIALILINLRDIYRYIKMRMYAANDGDDENRRGGSIRNEPMCLGIPGRIVSVDNSEDRLATVDVCGVKRQINISCIIDDDHRSTHALANGC